MRESDKLISTLWLSVLFILSLNSICKGIKLYLHVVPDIDMAVCRKGELTVKVTGLEKKLNLPN
jgi:hypothetical protein